MLGFDLSRFDGKFKLRLPAGEAVLYFGSIPRGYSYPRPQIMHELDLEAGQEPVTGLRLVLAPAKR